MKADEAVEVLLAENQDFRRISPDDLSRLLEWRNAQQAVLRQQVPLSAEHQSRWWADTVAPAYGSGRPELVLLALDRGSGITSYGGLTNIDWVNLRAEVSFLAETALAGDETRYARELRESLAVYARLAFGLLGLRRLFTETWSFRDRHIQHLEDFGFRPEGLLRQHVIKDGRPTDAILHGLLADDRNPA